jgi:hypothetical protein
MAARPTKLIALAVATGTVVAAGSTTAFASSTDTTTKSYLGNTSGFALHLEVNLPALSISETIATADGKVTKTDSLTGTAVASLFKTTGSSSLPVNVADIAGQVFDKVNATASANLNGKLSDAASLVPNQDLGGLGLIHVAAGTVASKIVPPSATAVTQSLTSSKVVNLNVGLGGQLAPYVQQVAGTATGALNTVSSTVTPVAQQLVNTITSALNQVQTGTPLDNTLNVVKTAVSNLPAQVTQLVTDLNTAINGLTGESGLLHVGLIGTDQQVVPNGSGLSATTTSEIGDVSVLGGLVGIDALKTIATAAANGVKGGALADVAKSSLAHVKIGSLVNVQATVDKINAEIAGIGTDQLTQALGVDAVGTLENLLSQLNGLLGSTGVQVGYLGTDTKNAATDGTAATAATDGIGIRVGVPAALAGALDTISSVAGGSGSSAAKPLIELQMVPASASVGQQVTTSEPQQVSTARINAPAGPAPVKKLAYTGASLPLTAGIGSVLLAGAAVAMRRRRSTEV